MRCSARLILPVGDGRADAGDHGRSRQPRVALSGEAPTLDLIANNEGSSPTGNDTGQLRRSARRGRDAYDELWHHRQHRLEIAAEGELWFFFLPIPTGGSIGLRQHFDAGDSFDFAIAAKVGSVRLRRTSSRPPAARKKESSARATYGVISAVMQSKRGPIRPLAAVSFMPATHQSAPRWRSVTSSRGSRRR